MDFLSEDNITPVLDRLLVRAPQVAADAVRRAATVVASDFEKAMPILSQVQINDKIGDVYPQTKPVLIRPTTDGIELVVRPFYADAYDFKIKQAVGVGGNAAKLTRQGLWVHKKLSKQHSQDSALQYFVEFEGAARLRQWAEDHDEVRRRAVLISTRVEIGFLWGPYRARLILDIHRQLALGLTAR